MKIYVITIATLVLILAAAFIQHNTRKNVQNGPAIQHDALYVCGWFPLCTDPDRRKPVLQLENIAEAKPDTALV